jgi:succinate dehydrogenase / fumarate reductase iron-sulfur subunit
LTQGWRYLADSRDEGCQERTEAVYSSHGVYRCHFAGACSQVCPKGVDPGLAIQLAKQDAFLKSMGARKQRPATALAPPVQNWVPKKEIAKPPAPTVEPKSGS